MNYPLNILRSRQMTLSVASLAIFLFSGCEPTSAQAVPAQADGEDAVPSRLPTSKELHEVTAPDYKPPNGVKSECFGRLTFDVAQPVEWPLFYNQNSSSLFNRTFSNHVFDPGDEMRFGKTLVAVIGSVGGVRKEAVLESTPAALDAHLRTRIEEKQTYIAELKAKGANTDRARRVISEQEEWIRGWEETIKEDQRTFEGFDPGVPNSEGYWTSRTDASDGTERYSVLRAYLTRGDLLYVFESSLKMKKPSDKESHKKDFVAMLARFRTRAANEVPGELGVCVPFGFIPDDGETVVEFKQSLRFLEAPNVIYTIETGNVHPRRLKITPVLAAAAASITPPPESIEDKVERIETQRIGPRLYKIGGLTGSQGGVILKVTQPGSEKYDMYDVFTGYAGRLGVVSLPYILVEMRSINKTRAVELKENPLPFKPSMERLELLLRSMRLRPTNPPMRELSRR